MTPTVAPAHFPYAHRNMAQIAADEAEFEAFIGRLTELYVHDADKGEAFIQRLRDCVERDGPPDMRRLRQEAHKAVLERTA